MPNKMHYTQLFCYLLQNLIYPKNILYYREAKFEIKTMLSLDSRRNTPGKNDEVIIFFINLRRNYTNL